MFREAFDNASVNLCESPIEQRMLAALVSAIPADINFAVDDPTLPMAYRPRADVVITPQEEVGRYRADFAIYCRLSGIDAIVECDGHDFHERTKEQAARDRKRDRTLASSGYMVLRFTGSEIWRDPISCAAEVWEAIMPV